MARRPPQGLTPEERALWEQVAKTATPLRRDAPKPPAMQPGKTPPPPPSRPRTEISAFQIGRKSGPPAMRHDLAAPIHERVKNAPVVMDRRNFDRLKRGKLSPEGRMDLHGMTLAQAQPALTEFIYRAQAAGKRLVLVITGKGRDMPDDGPIPQRRGQLRHNVPDWLNSPALRPLVLQVVQAHQRHGGGGAYYVYLRRPR